MAHHPKAHRRESDHLLPGSAGIKANRTRLYGRIAPRPLSLALTSRHRTITYWEGRLRGSCRGLGFHRSRYLWSGVALRRGFSIADRPSHFRSDEPEAISRSCYRQTFYRTFDPTVAESPLFFDDGHIATGRVR